MADNDENQLKGVYAKEVLRLVTAANDYCVFLEDKGDVKPVEFIPKMLKLSSEVYAAALHIEEFEPMLEHGNEKFVTEQDWSSVYQSVLLMLGSHNTYLRIAEDGEFDRSDLVTHTVSEDLADVYQDLKDFTLQYRQGIEEIMNDAVYELMENFDQFWSTKLLYAMQSLNRLYVNHINPENDEDEPDGDVGGNPPKYDNSLFTRLQDSNEEDI